MSYLKRYLRRTCLFDFINYTFTPAFGIFQLITTTAILICMLWCVAFGHIVFAVCLVSAHIVIFCISMLISLVRFRKYKTFGNGSLVIFITVTFLLIGCEWDYIDTQNEIAVVRDKAENTIIIQCESGPWFTIHDCDLNEIAAVNDTINVTYRRWWKSGKVAQAELEQWSKLK